MLIRRGAVTVTMLRLWHEERHTKSALLVEQFDYRLCFCYIRAAYPEYSNHNAKPNRFVNGATCDERFMWDGFLHGKLNALNLQSMKAVTY